MHLADVIFPALSNAKVQMESSGKQKVQTRTHKSSQYDLNIHIPNPEFQNFSPENEIPQSGVAVG